MPRALFSPCTLTLTLSRRGRGDVALPLRPGHPLRSLRSAKGTGLSEPRITLIALMGCDAPPLCPDGCLYRGLRVLSEPRITQIALMGCDAPPLLSRWLSVSGIARVV